MPWERACQHGVANFLQSTLHKVLAQPQQVTIGAMRRCYRGDSLLRLGLIATPVKTWTKGFRSYMASPCGPLEFHQPFSKSHQLSSSCVAWRPCSSSTCVLRYGRLLAFHFMHFTRWHLLPECHFACNEIRPSQRGMRLQRQMSLLAKGSSGQPSCQTPAVSRSLGCALVVLHPI